MSQSLSKLEEESIDYFASFVQVIGLPKSIGQIYGLLFISPEALPMAVIFSKLGISKGSLSQGLAFLREMGAVTTHSIEGDRRDYYRADLDVNRILDHFMENQLMARLEAGEEHLARMNLILENAVDDDAGIPEVRSRVAALEKWNNRGKRLMPVIVKWLKR